MKSILLTLLVAFTMLFTNCNQDCGGTVICEQPDINRLLQLNLDLSRFSAAELSEVQLVRIDDETKNVIDTLDINSFVGFEDIIIIGGAGSIPFNRSLLEDNEEPDTDFKVLVGSPAQEFTISDIRVGLINEGCGCPYYQLTFISLDGNVIESDSRNYTLVL